MKAETINENNKIVKRAAIKFIILRRSGGVAKPLTESFIPKKKWTTPVRIITTNTNHLYNLFFIYSNMIEYYRCFIL